MKRMSALLLTLLLAFSLTACGGTPAQDTPDAGTDTSASTPADSDTPTADEPSEPAKDESGNILVAYFSHTGNTEIIANMIAEQTGGDLFYVETTTVYPEEYNDLIAQARQEGRRAVTLTCRAEKLDYYASFGFQNRGVSSSVHGGAVWYDMVLPL